MGTMIVTPESMTAVREMVEQFKHTVTNRWLFIDQLTKFYQVEGFRGIERVAYQINYSPNTLYRWIHTSRQISAEMRKTYPVFTLNTFQNIITAARRFKDMDDRPENSLAYWCEQVSTKHWTQTDLRRESKKAWITLKLANRIYDHDFRIVRTTHLVHRAEQHAQDLHKQCEEFNSYDAYFYGQKAQICFEKFSQDAILL